MVLSSGDTVTTLPAPTPGQSIVLPGDTAVSVTGVPLQISFVELEAVTDGFARMLTTTGCRFVEHPVPALKPLIK
jgi:hypothetical protein